MARIKTVFRNTSEVCHVWAQQKQEYGKAGNVFFEGPSIYSYGKHFEIARFITPDIVFVNPARYSVSTSRHQRYVSDAITHKTVYFVPSMTDHTLNIKNYVAEINRQLDAFTRRRSMVSLAIGAIHDELRSAFSYVNAFKNDIDPALVRGIEAMYTDRKLYPTPQEIEKAMAREKVYNAQMDIKYAKKQAEEEERRKLQAIEQEKHLAEWLEGKGPYHSLWAITPTRLRVKDDAVETTRGASVPLSFCRRFWDRIKKADDVVGLAMGHYTITKITPEKITVGCHEIPMSEVRRLAKQLGW